MHIFNFYIDHKGKGAKGPATFHCDVEIEVHSYVNAEYDITDITLHHRCHDRAGDNHQWVNCNHLEKYVDMDKLTKKVREQCEIEIKYDLDIDLDIDLDHKLDLPFLCN